MIPQQGSIEISESRVRHNLDMLRRKLSVHTIICSTIKANAYGHSSHHLAPLFTKVGIQWQCTYALHEAIVIARYPTKPCPPSNVIALAPFVGTLSIDDLYSASIFAKAVAYRVRFTIVDIASARQLNTLLDGVSDVPEKIPVHVQVDSGLTRSGVSPADAPKLLQQILQLPRLHLEGIFTHLSHGDAPGHPTIADQIITLHKIADPIKREHPEIIIHAQNSGGTFNYSDSSLDMVRIGIALYGLQPSLDAPIPGLQPIARLVAPILMIHERPANTGVGYGHTFTTQRPSRLAIVPVGYADGYPRAMSNRGIVQIRGQNAPVVGRVSMDQIIIDVTDIPSAIPGDEVTVFSNDPSAPNCIDQIAKTCGTIGYEIATGMGPRLARRVVE